LLHGRRRIPQLPPVAVGDAHAIDIEVEPGRAPNIDQPDLVRPGTTRRLSNGRIQNGTASSLPNPHRTPPSKIHNGVAHPQQRVDRRPRRPVRVPLGIGRSQLRSTPRKRQVMQGSENHRRPPPPRRHRLDNPQRLVGLTQGTRNTRIHRRPPTDITISEPPKSRTRTSPTQDPPQTHRHPTDPNHREQLTPPPDQPPSSQHPGDHAGRGWLPIGLWSQRTTTGEPNAAGTASSGPDSATSTA